MRAARIVLVAFAGFALVVSFYAVSLVWRDAQPRTGLVSSTGVADIGGPFQLVDERGEPVSEQDLMGRPSAIFFGFTHCPDVCPTTLFDLTALMGELGPEADEVNFVMVTVDPERDTPEILGEYVKAFDPRFRGFTGSPEQVRRMLDVYRVEAERVPTERDYTMNHTASVYLMDSQNRFSGTISYREDPATALEKLRRLVG